VADDVEEDHEVELAVPKKQIGIGRIPDRPHTQKPALNCDGSDIEDSAAQNEPTATFSIPPPFTLLELEKLRELASVNEASKKRCWRESLRVNSA